MLDPLGDEDEDAPLEGLELAPPAEPLDEPELLGWALELELESLLELGEAELAPPEAEPDFDGSLEAEPDFDGSLEDELLLEEPGELGLDDAPAEGDEDAPLEGDVDDELLEGDELDGEVAEPELEPDEPGLDELLLESPRSHAARPKASATANAKVESFMSPPWLGYEKRGSKLRARPNPLSAQGLGRATGTLCLRCRSSYLLEPLGLPAPLELPVPLAPPLGLGDFLGELLGLVLLEPELGLPLAPDEPELAPEEELPCEAEPPDADLPPPS